MLNLWKQSLPETSHDNIANLKGLGGEEDCIFHKRRWRRIRGEHAPEEHEKHLSDMVTVNRNTL